MSQEKAYLAPNWFFALLSLAVLIAAAGIFYRCVFFVDHDYVILDTQGTGTWSEKKLVVPRLYDRKTGEFCEYRGQGAQIDYVSQTLRGPWLCYPGPNASK